tara:strand:+ start:928 stop:1674 length:747 start_codon:yes stop_codon:yes gene_type:complete
MALPTTGPLSIGQIQGEFGGSNPASLGEYYGAATGVPVSPNPLSISDFRGTSNVTTFTYTILGGGGAGGWGREDGYGYGRAASGGTSSISGSGFSTISQAGGLGGLNGNVSPYDHSSRVGASSSVGAGGTGFPNGRGANSGNIGGTNWTTYGDAPSSGAGGGGAGGDSPNFLDSSGGAGSGGGASSTSSGTVTLSPGTTITIVVGAGGVGTPYNYSGGKGGDGRVVITPAGSSSVTYSTAGTHTLTIN